MGAKGEQVKGHAKEALGNLTGDEDLEAEGKADRKAGEAKEKVEEVVETVKDKVEDLIDKTKHALHRK